VYIKSDRFRSRKAFDSSFYFFKIIIEDIETSNVNNGMEFNVGARGVSRGFEGSFINDVRQASNIQMTPKSTSLSWNQDS